LKKILKYAGIGLVALLILIQFIPVSHANPGVTQEVQWDSPQTQELAQRACFDCHSNETTWPWYSYVAPASWLVIHHVDDGRRRLNFSEWDQPNENEREITKTISSDQMPLWDYLLLHPEAKLTDAEQQVLLDGLKQTLTNDPPIERQRRFR
jgi:mono/diheme cytochrome c family protein